MPLVSRYASSFPPGSAPGRRIQHNSPSQPPPIGTIEILVPYR